MSLTFKPNLPVNKTHAQVMIEKIEGILEGRPDNDIASYQIGGRAINRLSIKELREARAEYLSERRRELQEEQLKAGKPLNNKMRVMFR